MSRKTWLKYIPAAIGALLAVLALVGILLLKSHFHEDVATQKKMVQQITVLNPPPPPPPPPPQEQIKEPEVKEEIKEETETPPEDNQPQSANQDLGVDAEGGAGGDGFGLVGKRGGSGLLGGGGYEQFVRQEISDLISDNAKLKHLGYVAIVTLWIDGDGGLSRIEVDMREGSPETKKLIELALQERKKLSKPRPLEAGDKITLRLKSVL